MASLTSALIEARFRSVLSSLHLYAKQQSLSFPTCFISYSWTPTAEKAEEYGITLSEKDYFLQDWLRKFQSDLAIAGIVAQLDLTHLEVGDHIVSYMKEGVEKADFGLVIGTPVLKKRSADELTNVYYELKALEKKREAQSKSVIGILRNGDFAISFPDSYLSYLLEDFRDDSVYFKQLIKLAGILLNISKEEFFLKKLENFETQCLEAQQKLWNISLNTKTFVGREKELEHLAKYCFPSEADRKRKVFVVSGSGGMGKSQLVRHFANSYSDRFQFGWWINSDSQSAILNDYVNLATSMELFPIEEDQSSKEITKKLVGLLGTRKDLSGWLIVLDNIEPDDAEDVFKNFIPQKGGLVIITSQSTLKKQLGSEECDPRFGEPMLKLSALSHDEGCTLLEKVSKKERTDAIGQIVDLLGCLPLAVNQAGSFIYENFCPPDEFLVQLKEQELIFFEEDQDFRSVSSTLILSINKIIETKPEAVLYLQKIAFLSPEEIPISVLSSVIEKETLTIEERKIIGMLDNYSIITLEQKGDQFSINRLMQLASRIYCTQEKFKNCPPQKECLEKLIQKMTFLLTEKDMSIADISRRKELMPHIESILSFLTQFNLQNSELTAELLIKYGLICARIGENAQRQKHLEKALQIQETIFGPSAFEIVETLSSLGASYYKIGNTVKAQELLERAKSLFEAKYGKNHPKVGQTLLDLGIVYGDLGNVKKKIELLELSLSIHENHYGSDHFKVSKVLANLGNAYGVIGETQKQKQVLERAIEIKESHYGKDHFEVGKTLTNLALVYGALQDFNRQKELLLRSLAIKEKYYGKDHTSVSTTLFHLGVVCGELGDYENEKLYLTKTLEIREKHFGKNNHQVAVVLSALAESHLRVNEPEKAITLAQSALAIQQNYYKSDNHELGKTIMILGFGYFETKEFIKSKEHLERAISMFQIVYSDQNHPNLTKCQNKIKQVHHLSTLPKDSINFKEYNGWMLKLGGKFVKDFQRRYFTFSKQEQILSWSKTVGGPSRNKISVQDIQEVKILPKEETKKEFSFEISGSNIKKKYILVAPDQSSLDMWISILSEK